MIRKICIVGNPVLRKKCKKVKRIDPSIIHLLDDMAETMYAAPGIGLAAPQIGKSVNLVVIDVGEGLHKLINPRIVSRGEEKEYSTEGCLSVPNTAGEVERFMEVTVKATLPDGKNIKIEAEGLFAICLQHEIDHLSGVLFIDKAINIREGQEDEEELEDISLDSNEGVCNNFPTSQKPAIFEKL